MNFRQRWLIAVMPAAVLLVWIVMIALLAPLAAKLSSVQENDPTLFLPSSAESTRVQKLEASFASSNVIPAVIVYERRGGITAADRARAQQQADSIARLAGVAGPPSTPIPSADGRALETIVPIKSDTLTSSGDIVNALRRIATSTDGLTVHVAGPAGLAADFGAAFKALDLKLLIGTTLVVVLVLLAVYRSPFLWVVPLLSVGAAVVLAQALVYIAASRFGLHSNGQSQGILTVLLFGAGTDYALLLVSRYREELRRSVSSRSALVVALRGAAPPILASGTTVILSLLCLALAQDGANRSLGQTGAIGIASAMVAMLTFLPAVLGLLGRRLFWPLTPRPSLVGAAGSSIWDRIASFVGRRSTTVLVTTGLVLAVVGLGVTQLKADGIPALDQYTVAVDSTVGQRIIDQHFAASETSTATVIAMVGRATAVQTAAEKVPGVVAASAATEGVVDGRVLLTVSMRGVDGSPTSTSTVQRLRAALHAVPGADALVGGSTAAAIDTAAAARHDFVLIVPIVLVLITLVLLVLLRSLVAPLLLIGTVILSFAASLGLAALLFKYVFHFAGADASLPLTAFVFLIALGIDYNIFLISRVRELAKIEGPRSGVLGGLSATGSVITSAGLVLAATFSVFAVLPLVLLAEVGIAVAVGVLVDTIVVRSLLVPALFYRLGPAAWWPARLHREGHHHLSVLEAS